MTAMDVLATHSYQSPMWLPGGHAQTLYAALGAPRPRVTYRRERWDTPDGDFIDLDWAVRPAPPSRRSDLTDWGEGIQHTPRNESPIPGIREPATAPLVVLFHGLEGSSRSHYALALMHAVRARGWRGVVVHFRGCSGEMNRLPRAYHSGDSTEIDWILRRLKRLCPHAPLHAVGVSLGGNALLKWLGEQRGNAVDVISAAASVSAPVDLMASGEALGHGFNLVYARHFLVTLKRKSLVKLGDFPGLFDGKKVSAAHTLREFDNTVTAPLHGYLDTDDYWTRASSKPLLRGITVPTLLVNACNDPFLPCGALPAPHEVSPQVLLEQPENGGHVGFMSGPFPGNLGWLPQRILEFFDARDKTTNTTRPGEWGQVRQAASDFIDLH